MRFLKHLGRKRLLLIVEQWSRVASLFRTNPFRLASAAGRKLLLENRHAEFAAYVVFLVRNAPANHGVENWLE